MKNVGLFYTTLGAVSEKKGRLEVWEGLEKASKDITSNTPMYADTAIRLLRIRIVELQGKVMYVGVRVVIRPFYEYRRISFNHTVA